MSFLSFDEASIAIKGTFVPYSVIYVCFDETQDFCREEDGRTHNILATLPGDPLYSPLWDVSVYDAAQFDTVTDLDAALAVPAIDNLPMVNCPLAR